MYIGYLEMLYAYINKTIGHDIDVHDISELSPGGIQLISHELDAVRAQGLNIHAQPYRVAVRSHSAL